MRSFQINIREKTTEYGFMPTLQLYLLDGQEKRPMVIVVPGGGYMTVSPDEEKTALQYNAAGFHAAVLNYCVDPHHFPNPQMDLAEAIRLIRENAEDWSVHREKIAICGFSAGGHLCASLSTLWNNESLFSQEEINAGLYKPNACILYSAILTTEVEHCKKFLCGHVGEEKKENLELAACDKQVNPQTPPTFIFGTYEDKLTTVENALYYAEALSKNQIPFEIHIFPKGGHGEPWCDEVTWGKAAEGRDYRTIKLSVEWLMELFEL